VDTIVNPNRRRVANASLEELTPEMIRQLSDSLAGVEESRLFGGAKKKPVSLKSAPTEKMREPGSPTERNTSLFTGGTTQVVEETRKDTMEASANIVNVSDITAAKNSTQDLFSTGGATGNLTDQEADTIREDAQRADPATIIGYTRGKVGGASTLKERVGRILDNTASDAYMTANATDVVVNMEQAADAVESADAARKRLTETLNTVGIPQSKMNDVMRNLGALSSSPLGESDLTPEEIVTFAADTAKKASAPGVEARPSDVLGEIAEAAKGGKTGPYAEQMLKDLMLNIKVQKNPDLMEWIESIMTDKADQMELKAA